MNWKYIDGADQQIDSSEAQIRAQLSLGQLTGEEWAWYEGLEDWAPIHQLLPDAFERVEEVVEQAVQTPTVAAVAPSPAPEAEPASAASTGPVLQRRGTAKGKALLEQRSRANAAGLRTSGTGLDGSLNIEHDKMTFTNVLFSFKGRISVSQFWMAVLFSLGLTFAGLMLVGLVSLVQVVPADGEPGTEEPLTLPLMISAVLCICLLVVLSFSAIAVYVKRFHDRDKSGWWVLLCCIPFISFWPFIEMAFCAGTPGPNRYGADPKKMR